MSPIRFILIGLAFGFAALSTARLALFALSPASFQTLDADAVASAFLRGLRFDTAVVAFFLGAPALLYLLPAGGFVRSSAWRRCWTWVGFIGWAVLNILLVVDIGHFGTFGCHLSTEVFEVRNHGALVLSTVLHSFPGHAVVLLLLLGAGAFAWGRLSRHVRNAEEPGRGARWAVWTAMLALAILGFRGRAGGMILRPNDAYEGFAQEAGVLALNGPFVLFHSLSRSGDYRFLSLPEARRRALLAEVLGEGSRIPDPDHPLWRKSRVALPPERRLNLLVISLESWSASATDALRVPRGLPALGATPNFDELASQGVLFEDFYANGSLSVHSWIASTMGVPYLPWLPAWGKGLELVRFTHLGTLARQHGYSTFVIEAFGGTSFDLRALKEIAGIGAIRYAGDIPTSRPAPGGVTVGVWDEDLFPETSRLIAAQARPYLGFVFTISSHFPFVSPGPDWERFKGGTQRDAYLNTVAYTDDALGRFVRDGRASGLLDDTVLIILGDHTFGGLPGDEPDAMRAAHGVPCLILDPRAAPGRRDFIASQFDLMPTILDILGLDGAYACAGRSLLDQSVTQDSRWAACTSGRTMSWVDAGGWVRGEERQLIEASPGGTAGEAQARWERLHAVLAELTRLVRAQAVVPRSPP